MKLLVKNMVCPRCIRAVEQILQEEGIAPLQVQLGEVLLAEELSAAQKAVFKNKLEALGFELLDDSRSQEIEKIKAVIIAHIQQLEDRSLVFSQLLAGALHRDYSQLSKLFSAVEGITIEQYIILQKIEKAKELLAYHEMNLNEIADKLGYSSAAHLSAQFKKTTGFTPTQFRSRSAGLRLGLDQVQGGII